MILNQKMIFLNQVQFFTLVQRKTRWRITWWITHQHTIDMVTPENQFSMWQRSGGICLIFTSFLINFLSCIFVFTANPGSNYSLGQKVGSIVGPNVHKWRWLNVLLTCPTVLPTVGSTLVQLLVKSSPLPFYI